MNNRALTLSLLMAVIAWFFIDSYVSSIEEDAHRKFGTEVVVVSAKEDIREMMTLNESMLHLKEIPVRFLEPGAISFEKSEVDGETALKSMKELSATVAIVPIKKGEQITYNKITEPNLRTGLSPQVTPGKRAVAIPVNEYTGVGKLVKPGDRVDIIGVVTGADGNDSKIAKTILQDVAILAVGRNITNNVPRVVEKDARGKTRTRSLTASDRFNSVTVEVDPIQVQKLVLMTATGAGNLFLSLRNNDDSDRMGMNGVMINDILGADFSRIRRSPAGRRR
ncbi:MAG: Flp pilus assembly protein CpaB [Bdellovibrionaceae bacterium]|nr:Flp pilus assembly protein CpaB [Pseudobdellovibrionaceae bacterium]|tara:strand:- start:1183 stop:2022 length:840 start_codon:yes stop_codon:yes gene_type:complete